MGVSGNFLFKPISPSAQDYMMYYLGKRLDRSNIRTVQVYLQKGGKGIMVELFSKII